MAHSLCRALSFCRTKDSAKGGISVFSGLVNGHVNSILKKVSRSFYLTIRLLPLKLREPVTLAYLLARASDTIADVQEISHEEQELFNLLPLLLEKLETQNEFDRAAINKVWIKILEGQLFELDLFNRGQGLIVDKMDRIIAEQKKYFINNQTLTPIELDRYLYLVAGSVGEFWTELSAHQFKNVFREPTHKMMTLGVAYGKGLQLINILRDRSEDEMRGRLYYEASQLSELVEQAGCYLEQGKIYIRAIKHRRLRYASALPVLLAEKTLKLILEKGSAKKVKIGRGAVYLTLVRALFF